MLTAALAASCTMKAAGEIAWRNLTEEEGNASYRNRMIDAVYRMDGDRLGPAALCGDRPKLAWRRDALCAGGKGVERRGDFRAASGKAFDRGSVS